MIPSILTTYKVTVVVNFQMAGVDLFDPLSPALSRGGEGV